MVDQIDQFNLKQGGYMRTVTPFPLPIFSLSKAGFSTSKVEMILEAVTPNFGANFDRYEMVVRFVDNTISNGNSSKTDRPLRVLNVSEYTKDPTTGYPRFQLVITGQQMLTTLGLSLNDITATDRFEIRCKMFLKDGTFHDATNSSGDILGGAFYSSPFLYRAAVAN